jgi:hypothetical protein
MIRDEECVKYAHECERLAGLIGDPDIRERLLSMARAWMAEATRSQTPPTGVDAS